MILLQGFTLDMSWQPHSVNHNGFCNASNSLENTVPAKNPIGSFPHCCNKAKNTILVYCPHRYYWNSPTHLKGVSTHTVALVILP